jgi:inward rectifier potassium channel
MHRAIHHDHQHTSWYRLWRQPLACMIRMPWPIFFVAMGLIYLAETIGFALLLHPDASSLEGDAPMGLPKAFVFAASAFFANAFNDIEPESSYTYLVGNVAMVAGIITLSTLTAVVFSRLSSSESPLHFSRYVCISGLSGGHLFCRFITNDPSQWLNVSYTLSLIVDELLEPGLWQRRVHQLDLLNPGTPQLSQTATLIHGLNADSPLAQMGIEELQRRNAVLIAMVEGIDEATGAGLLQTHLYRPDQLLFSYRFADLVSHDANGRQRVQLNRLNHTVPLGSESPKA